MKNIFPILLDGLKQTGNYYDCYIYILEKLPCDSLPSVEGFLGWLEQNDYKVGHGNIQSRYDEYCKLAHRQRRACQNAFKSKDRKKAPKDITTEFVKDNTVDIHVFGYPLKNAKVVEYNKEANTITLSLL